MTPTDTAEQIKTLYQDLHADLANAADDGTPIDPALFEVLAEAGRQAAQVCETVIGRQLAEGRALILLATAADQMTTAADHLEEAAQRA